jgi:hypothetical protein
MGEIEHAMTRERNDDDLKGPLESNHRDGHEDNASQQVEKQGMSGITQDGKKHVGSGNDDRDNRIEASVTIEPGACGKQSHQECEYCADCQCHDVPAFFSCGLTSCASVLQSRFSHRDPQDAEAALLQAWHQISPETTSMSSVSSPLGPRKNMFFATVPLDVLTVWMGEGACPPAFRTLGSPR